MLTEKDVKEIKSYLKQIRNILKDFVDLEKSKKITMVPAVPYDLNVPQTR